MTASWEPPGLATWLGFATDSTAVLGRSSQCSGTRFVEPPSEATLTVYGCQGGSGTVELRAGSITGRLLDSITITVRTPTPTYTPDSAPRGELSATKTAIDVGETVTVSAVNVSPSSQSVYIVTNGRLDFARPGTCHFEINPRSSGRSAKSWTLEGCSPPGSGSVTLKTSHNGQTLVLDSITIDVSPAPTPTNTPITGPTVGPTVGPTTEPTDTPSPTPTLPTGWITAAPMKIAVGQTTTITATWNTVASTPKLSFGPQLAERCAGIQGQGVQGRSVLDTELVAKATQTLTGCTAGTVTVKLLDGSTELDAVTVAVVAKPSIQATRRIGYRWFNIGWTAARPYTSFAIEWRNEGEGESDWSELVQSGQSGARAIMSGMAAAIRGLPHEDKRIEIRVIARGSGGLEGRSDTLRYARDTQPTARGHLPDHTMVYIDVMPTSTSDADFELAGWIRNEMSSAASAWADLVPELDLEACSTTCARNEDKEIFWIEIDADCNHRAACVKGLPAFHLGLELEGRIVGSGLRMVFVPEGTPLTAHKWTTDPTWDGKEVGDGRVYRWIDRVVVHEFGHTFGLADRDPDGTHPDPNYRGIMNRLTGDKGIKPDDRAALWAIYGTHTRNHGW